MDRQAKFRFIGISILSILLISLLVYAVGTSLDSPIDNFVDDDGYLELKGACSPTLYDDTTSYNISNGTIYSTVGGDWKANKTTEATGSMGNSTYLFNFTINQSNEGTYQWDILCVEFNTSDTTRAVSTSFANNRTIIVTYANPSVTAITPEDDFYDMDGNEINGTCAVSPTTGWNITSISLMVNLGGTWLINETYTITAPGTADYLYNFTINAFDNSSIADGTDVLWGCRVTQQKNASGSANEGLVTSVYSTPNRTINIEYPPIVTSTYPSDGFWDGGASSTLNFSTISEWTDSPSFNCELLTNESGTWGVARSIGGTNNTNTSISYQFEQLSEIEWGIRCFESRNLNVFNFSINRTIKVDRTNPIISIAAPSSGSFLNDKPFNVTYSLTELYESSCSLHLNNSINSTATDTLVNFTVTDIDDGTYEAIVECRDLAGNIVNSSSVTFTLDTVIPPINKVGNFSVSGSSHQRLFNFSSDELVNVTVFYGTTVDTTSSQGNADYSLTQDIIISDFEENTVYYWNLTVCDRSGNCNMSAGTESGFLQFDFTFPWKLLTGWSYYGIWDSKINFSDILTATETEFVYYWNQTNQEWIAATSGGSTNMGFEVGLTAGDNGGRHVVVLYEDDNSTWVRNTTASTEGELYLYNFTTGDNYIKLPTTDHTFGNFSVSLMNGSGVGLEKECTFNVELCTVPGIVDEVLTYNLTEFWFSAYNNTGVTWEPYYIYNFTAENNTVLTSPGPHEIMWVWSEDNLTWNGTNIYANWTI